MLKNVFYGIICLTLIVQTVFTVLLWRNSDKIMRGITYIETNPRSNINRIQKSLSEIERDVTYIYYSLDQ
jgi:hypothetical protein